MGMFLLQDTRKHLNENLMDIHTNNLVCNYRIVCIMRLRAAKLTPSVKLTASTYLENWSLQNDLIWNRPWDLLF